MACCSSSHSVLSCLLYPKKQAEVYQSKVKRSSGNTFPLLLREGGASILYLHPGYQETLGEAEREGQEEEARTEQEKH